MFYEGVVLLSVCCSGLLAANSNESDVWILPSEVIECGERAKDEPVNQTLATEACMRTYFVDRLSANVMDQNDWDFFEQEFANKMFGKKRPPSGYRVRRDIRVLNVTERHKLYNAFNALYRNGTLARFGRLHATEVYRKHHGAAFLPWHRVFIAAFEEQLREVDPDVSLPYWDYSMDYYMPLPSDSIVWSKCFFGNGIGTVNVGPFSFMYGGYNMPISRDIAQAATCPPKLISKEDIDELMKFCNFADITTGKNLYQDNSSHNLEKLHNGVHDWVGGDMGVLGTAAYDPVFYMHHAFIDYIWEQFRRRQTNECQVDVEKDYRKLGDYSVADNGQQGPNDPMQGFEYLKYSDGLWKNWTTDFYDYEKAPECPNCGYSDFLYCDMSINPNRPNGVCVPKTNDSCVNTLLMAFNRDEPHEKPQGGGAKLSLGPRHIGLPGDGRTRFMSREEGLALLKQQLALDIDKCMTGMSGCAHKCSNQPGGYQCSCLTGFQLQADEHSCLGSLRCHCREHEQCKEDGSCNGECAPGMFGPGCQYVDIAHEHPKMARHSSIPKYVTVNKYAPAAVDYDADTCSETGNETGYQWWRKSFPYNVTFTYIEFHLRADHAAYMSHYRVSVANVSDWNDRYEWPKDITCYETLVNDSRIPRTRDNRAVLGVFCNQPVVGNTIRIELRRSHTQLVLCDVYISQDPAKYPPNELKTNSFACENRFVNLYCNEGHIRVLLANYGRFSRNVCGKNGIDRDWNVQCSAKDSIRIVSERCDHKRSCDVQASNAIFGDPCPFTPKYLEIEYFCYHAGCAKPEGNLVNMEKQFYDDGDTISITDRNCETGYVPSSGDITLTCKSGQWSKEISCVPATNYKIRVVTADTFGAGTDGNVYIRLKGTAGDTGNIGLPGRFDRKSTEDKNMFLSDVGTIISVDIGVTLRTIRDGWMPSQVTVHDQRRNQFYLFQHDETELYDSSVTLQRKGCVIVYMVEKGSLEGRRRRDYNLYLNTVFECMMFCFNNNCVQAEYTARHKFCEIITSIKRPVQQRSDDAVHVLTPQCMKT